MRTWVIMLLVLVLADTAAALSCPKFSRSSSAQMSKKPGKQDHLAALAGESRLELESSAPVPSSPLERGTLILGYSALVAVNVASSMGVFGPSNVVVSVSSSKASILHKLSACVHA